MFVSHRLRIVSLPRSVEFFDIQTISQICYYNGYSAGSVQKVIERVSTPSPYGSVLA